MYTPKVPPDDPSKLLPYLDDEFIKVAAAVNGALVGEHDILYKAPVRIKPGMVVIADGVSWNPGSGEGMYRRTLGGAWKFIG